MIKIDAADNNVILMTDEEIDLLVRMCDRALAWMDTKSYGMTASEEANEIHENLIQINT